MSTITTASPRPVANADVKSLPSILPDAYRHLGLVGTMLFLSGVAALLFQILWIRQLTLVVGIEIYSITVTVSAFFAGLAAGGYWFGRLADRQMRPLKLYLWLEAGTAVTGWIATFILAHVAGLFVETQARLGLVAWLLPFVLVGIPAFLMGGTLPAAVRFRASVENVTEAGGWIYSINTAGAIAGTLLSSFLLIPWLGIRGTASVAAVLNLIAAAMAFVLDRRSLSSSSLQAANKVAPIALPDKSQTALTLYAVAGGIAMGYEVIWSQAMAQFLSTRVFAVSVVLATYLAGIAIGSALYVRFSRKITDPWGVFALLVSLAGAVALFEIAGLSLWQLRFQIYAGALAYAATGSEVVRMCAQFLVVAMGIVFLPTLLLGAAFPAVLRLSASDSHAGRDVGVVLALNTAGGIAGTLFTAFVLIPVMGIIHTLAILAVAAATVGACAILLGEQAGARFRWAVCVIGVAVVAGGILTPSDRLARLLLTTRGGGELIFYKEGRGATVAVAAQKSGDHVFRRLYIQGVSNSGDAMPSLRYMRMQALLPLIIHRGKPESALVIGFGTGITAGAVLHYPDLQRRACVELLPAVVQAGRLFPENYNADSDPRMRIRIGDGRQELLRSSERYDLITLEPPPPSAEGIVNLYSTDFYRLAIQHLEQNGLFAQWLPVATQRDKDTRSLVRSFLDVFPYATLWTTELHEMLLIGSSSPIELDARTIVDRFNQRGVSTPFEAIGISSPGALLATWVMNRGGLERYAANAKPVTDDDPRIEYAPWVNAREITNALPQLLTFSSDPPVQEADDALRQEIRRQRASLWDFYTAGIAAYNGDRDTWNGAMQRVRDNDPDNRYYLWIEGGDN